MAFVILAWTLFFPGAAFLLRCALGAHRYQTQVRLPAVINCSILWELSGQGRSMLRCWRVVAGGLIIGGSVQSHRVVAGLA